MLIPKKTEILVLPTPSWELLKRLNYIVYTTDDKQQEAAENEYHLFTGTIDQNAFVLSLKMKRPDNFIPLIKGNIEDTSKGSIVFLKYTLFKSTRMFLVFWTVLIFILAIILIVLQGKFWYASIALLASIANYAVTMINFGRKLKVSRDYLMKVFS